MGLSLTTNYHYLVQLPFPTFIVECAHFGLTCHHSPVMVPAPLEPTPPLPPQPLGEAVGLGGRALPRVVPAILPPLTSQVAPHTVLPRGTVTHDYPVAGDTPNPHPSLPPTRGNYYASHEVVTHPHLDVTAVTMPGTGMGFEGADPAMFVRGVLAKRLRSAPPTPTELEEYQYTIGTKLWDDQAFRFNRHVQSSTIPRFTGSGEAKEFANWRNALRLYFARYAVSNSAIQAALAVGSLTEIANA